MKTVWITLVIMAFTYHCIYSYTSMLDPYKQHSTDWNPGAKCDAAASGRVNKIDPPSNLNKLLKKILRQHENVHHSQDIHHCFIG